MLSTVLSGNSDRWDKEVFDICKEGDIILLGAVGLPDVHLPTGTPAGTNVIFGLRFGLDLYANVRPAKLYPCAKHNIANKFELVWQNMDFVTLREDTEGL